MNIAVGGIIQRSFRFVGGFGIDGGFDVVGDVDVVRDVDVVGDVGIGVQLEMNGLRNLEGGGEGGGVARGAGNYGRRKGRDR